MNPYETVPSAAYELATSLYRDDRIVSMSWDDERHELLILTDPGADAHSVDALIERADIDAPVRVRPSTYSKAQLEEAVSDVISLGNVQGMEVAWAAPRPDGEGIDIGVVDIAPAAIQRGVLTADGLPIRVYATGEAVPASRDRDASPYIAGADMNRDAGRDGYMSVCSTAFAHAWRNGSAGRHEPRIFTADHCSAGEYGTVETWRTGRRFENPEIGTTRGGFGTESDITAIGGKEYGPYMYHGPNTSNSAVAIWGWATPLVGAHLCYSGAPSGTVCSNEVTHVGLTVTYSGGGGTYRSLMRTEQVRGVPAVGNGDSGGPAFAVFEEGRAMAVGIISGMQNAGTDCTGDPSTETRRCSNVALMAPLAEYFHFNPLDYLLTYRP